MQTNKKQINFSLPQKQKQKIGVYVNEFTAKLFLKL